MARATRRRVRGAAGAAALAAVVGLWGTARAVVVQVNGKIVPDCADNIAYALARGELAGNCAPPFPIGNPGCWSQAAGGVPDCSGTPPPAVPNNNGNPGSQGAINPVNEARIDPQVFVIPKVASGASTVFGQVTATFVWRNTAGYRNTFGWYNAGDDVAILTNLHPILPSWPPPVAGGQAYDQAGQGAPFQATVDFQAEFTANRYKGGFVGFYLMTPQGQADVNTGTFANWDTCNEQGHSRGYYPYAGAYNHSGTPPNTPPANACVGYTYFTERALNGDGNYVHFLVYQTKVLDATKVRYNDFYFTFEDTYRSNDLGYADNTLFVQGLVTPCVPQPETCNGLDDDCDGVIDNAPVDAGGTCSQIPGNKPGVGICKAGTEVCRLPVAQGGVPGVPGHASNDQLFCDGEVGPAPESCNGLDDDCSGKVDDPGGVTDPTKQVWGPTTGSTPLPNQCATLLGTCKGTTECISGVPACVQTTSPSPEKCDGKDDNCNGIIDDNPSDVGLPCYPPGGTPQGACKAGVTVCLPGNDPTDTLSCSGWVGPQPETCNGIDDDCNGKVDDGLTDVGPAFTCTPSGVSGVCTPGHYVCVNGARVCTGFGFGTPETCNGIDDNCNTIIDDNPVDANVPCGSNVGACKQGLLICRLPDAQGGVSGVPGHSVGDQLVCDGATGPTAEQCNAIDDDCNGIVDDGPDGTPGSLPGVGVDCSTKCGPGKTICKDGAIQCAGTVGGTVEVCNGLDDDCNGIVDDNPIDAGGQCGTSVVDPSIRQNPDCKLGTWVCRLPDSAGGVSGQPNHSPGDVLVCDGEVRGVPETCNGIDDNCNGVVDDNVPGQGVDCAPPGLTLPVTGECRPGKLYCIAGTMQCVGAIGPKSPLCDGRDHDCNGQVDVGPCPDPTNKCVQGVCRIPCQHAVEFSSCPGGTSCVGGYCVPPDCTGKCGPGLVCDVASGQCLPGDGGTSVTGTGGAPGSDGGLGASGATGADAGTGATAGVGGTSAGGSTSQTSASAGATGAWGLASGGGGCTCRTSPRRSPSPPAWALSLLLVAVAARRGTTRRRAR